MVPPADSLNIEWIHPVNGLKHRAHPLVGPESLQPSSPMWPPAEKHAHKQVSKLPHGLSRCWLGPPGPSCSQLLLLSHPQRHARAWLLDHFSSLLTGQIFTNDHTLTWEFSGAPAAGTQTHGSPAPCSDSCCWPLYSLHTHTHRMGDTNPGKQLEVDFNKKPEKTADMTNRAPADQQPVYMELAPFILL